MKMNIKAAAFASAAIISASVLPTSASAQVAGVATTDPVQVVISSKAFRAAYQQIETTFASNRNLMVTRSKEINELLKQLDTNKDNQLDQAESDAAEKAKSPVFAQVDVKKKEIEQLSQPIDLAKDFVADQMLAKYQTTLPQVATAKNLTMVLTNDSFLWGKPTLDITKDVVTALDLAAPTVGITPPANYQPSRDGDGIRQQFEQYIRQLLAQQAAQQAGKPATAPAVPGTAPKPAPKPTPDSR